MLSGLSTDTEKSFKRIYNNNKIIYMITINDTLSLYSL